MVIVLNSSEDQLDRASAGSSKLSTVSKVPLFLGHPAPYICKSGICGGEWGLNACDGGSLCKLIDLKRPRKIILSGVLLSLSERFDPGLDC